ncbi:MAG: hypothetical protein HYR55_13235 [Acidobacteria bacterium]|nr:hypothetical protein [Acidobacteriota bacterium]
MKNTSRVLSLLWIALLGVALWTPRLAIAQSATKEKPAKTEKSIEGTLIDVKCYLGGGFKGNEHMGVKTCGTMCAKSGLPVAVLDSKDTVYHLMIPAPAVAEYIGMKVRVKGKVDSRSSSVTADYLEVNKDGKWERVKIESMM